MAVMWSSYSIRIPSLKYVGLTSLKYAVFSISALIGLVTTFSLRFNDVLQVNLG